MKIACRLIRYVTLLSFVVCPPLKGEDLDPVQPGPEWSSLFENLRTQVPLRAGFTESRTVKLRKEPVRMEGTLRLRTDGVISLHYPDTKKAVTVVISASEVSLRMDTGRWRTMPDRARNRSLLDTMAALMKLDLPKLGQTHTIEGHRAGAQWKLVLDPKPGQAPGLGRLLIEGTPEQVSRIELNLEPGQVINIEIDEVEPHVTLSPDETSRFFR